VYIQSGIGNLGTESVTDCHPRDWPRSWAYLGRNAKFTWGHTGRNSAVVLSIGRQPDDGTRTRGAAYVTALDAKDKLTQIAAKDLGGRPEDYDVAA